jgi:hypothetical protein
MPNELEPMEPKMNNGPATRFFGGSPLAVLGLDPFDIVHSLDRLIRSLWDMGFDAVRWLWRYFLLGAVIVIPIWLIMRLINAPRGK